MFTQTLSSGLKVTLETKLLSSTQTDSEQESHKTVSLTNIALHLFPWPVCKFVSAEKCTSPPHLKTSRSILVMFYMAEDKAQMSVYADT